MFTSTLLSRLTKSTPQPLLPVSSSPSPSPSRSLYSHTPTTPLPSQTDTNATLLALARQEAHLQSHIQYLLDVQSDRLLEGLGDAAASPIEDASLHPSSQAPYTDDDASDVSPAARSRLLARNPKPPPSLRAARTGIATALADLHTLKSSTWQLVSASLTSTSEKITTITHLQSKKEKLEATIQSLSDSPLTHELSRLEAEEESLEREIREVEGRLYELKARQRVVREKVQEGRNRREARGSSWLGEMEIVDQDIGNFLREKRPATSLPLNLPGKTRGDDGVEEESRESVYDLPPQRRTLPLLSDYHIHAKRELETQQRDLDTEIEALQQGGEVWQDVTASS
ncbi:MAG: hypothetical protein Q9222_006697 [Ikaeria aurantiellina]